MADSNIRDRPDAVVFIDVAGNIEGTVRQALARCSLKIRETAGFQTAAETVNRGLAGRRLPAPGRNT